MSAVISMEGVARNRGLQSLLRWLPGAVVTLLAAALLAKTVPCSAFVHALTLTLLWLVAVWIALYLAR